MKESEVREMAMWGVFENARVKGTVEETHISWVILTKKFAIKVKKPIKLDFLDFSTLQLRKTFCEREIVLNSRFSTIYLSVQPIRLINQQWVIGSENDIDIVDYCVVMKRMAVAKRMDNCLRAHKVNERSIEALARETATFHNKAEKIFIPFEVDQARNTFNEIDAIQDFASQEIASHVGEIVSRSIEWSDAFLANHEDRMQQRIEHGLKRDVHGDLHSGNIFLYKQPILFDCIEFNDQYRQIDILYDIAFLCMDLEAFHQKHLSEYFVSEYKKHIAAFQSIEDYYIFVYFKSLRANIRARVHAISADQAESKEEKSHHISETKKYLSLMNEYMASLQSVLQVTV